ncbi:MAG: tRNA pseudouridine(38-40) synthase TruA [Candidatus Lokiarchaeota archaeon]|nr:tRNA pseudouridine(38-40) synthase TruA [Candidatus Lokiarchaeota archaeon]
MTSYLLRIFYLGSRYHGSQIQPDLATIQGELICAFSDWSGEEHTAKTIQLAGRTDRGVHSLGQIGLVNTKKKLEIEEVNRILPDDIVLWAAAEAPPNFNVRYDILFRHYRYYWPTSEGLDVTTVQQVAQQLVGTHDFSGFAKPDPYRTNVATILNIAVRNQNGLFVTDIYGTSFLWKMVRKIVSVLIEVGMHKMNASIVGGLLSGNDISGGIHPAPPECLVLMESVVPLEMKSNISALYRIRGKLRDYSDMLERVTRTLNSLNDDLPFS